MFDKDNKFGFIVNNSNNNELNSSDIKKYVDDKADILELKNIETISENLYSKNFLIVESKLADIISFEQMRNSTVNANYKAPLFVCNINKSLDNLNDLDELFFSIKYKVGNEIKTGNMSVKIKYGTSVQIELLDTINYAGTKTKYSSLSVRVLPNKRCTNATASIDDNSYCVLQVRILSGYVSEEDINSLKDSIVSVYVRRRNYLTLDNSSEFTPTDAYQPTTKRYVDNKFLIDELETVLTVPKSELDKCNDTGAGISPSQNLNVINPNDGKHIYYACYGDIMNEITYTSDKLAGYTGTLCELEDGHAIELCMTFSNNNLVTCSTGFQSVKNYVFTNDLIIKSKKILEIDEIATKKYVDDNRDYYFKVPTILYDDSNLPKGYVDITTLEQGTNYRVNSSIVSGFFKVSLKAPNDDGTWFTVDDGSNTIGWSSMLSTSICVQLKSDTFIAINMNCINNYCKYLSITKENGKWKLMQTKLDSISPDNTYKYDVTNDYNPAHKKYVDDKVSSLPQISFNENGELVVTINGVSKTFVPKA